MIGIFDSGRGGLSVLRRIHFCICFAGIPIFKMRSDGLTMLKLVDQIGKLHLANCIGVLKRLPLATQVLELAERHLAVFPSGIE
jgi:hypothetical protein